MPQVILKSNGEKLSELILKPQPVQRLFLESEQKIVLFGGGEYCASTLKTAL